MKERVLLLTVLIVTAISCKCQLITNYDVNFVTPNFDKPIKVVKSGKHASYFQDKINLSVPQIQQIVKNDELASKYVNKAQNLNVTAKVFACTGGACVAYSAVDLIVGKHTGRWDGFMYGGQRIGSWIVFGSGAALLISAIPISLSSKKPTEKGVNTYNNNLESEKRVSFDIGTTANGVGLVMNF